MKRDIAKLKSEVFDVLIIGAGIHGATIAWALSASGYKTALIDSHDFGASTSANSLKIIHGGLRYLQHGDLKRIRESIISRKIFQKIAPYCVRNMPCVIPTYGFGFRSKPVLYMALKLYDMLSLDKNWSLAVDQRITSGFTISKRQFLEIVPNFNGEDVTGGAVWFETLAENSERLGLEFIHSAFQLGCTVGNYVRALKINQFQKGVQGIDSEETLSGEKFQIKSKIIINATGPYLNNVLKDFSIAQSTEVPLCKAINIIVNKKIFNNYAVGLEGIHEFKDHDSIIKKSNRFFFFVPWKNHTMIGTTYSIYDDDPLQSKVEKKDLIEIIEEVNMIYPSANLKVEDVTFYHVGILPRDATQDPLSRNIQPAKKSLIIDHERELGFKGLYSVLSVKYTTAPYIALKIIKLLKRGHSDISTNYSSKILPRTVKTTQNNSQLFKRYGDHSIIIQDYFKSNQYLKKNLYNGSRITEGEIKYFIEEECAVRLDDIVFRRTDIGSYSFPEREFLLVLAQKMSAYLNWKEERVNLELENVINKYSLLQIK